MASLWPSTTINVSRILPEDDFEVNLPPMAVQDRLVDLYFSYVHPMLPVIHKGRFLREWKEWSVLFTRTPFQAL